MLPDCDDIEQQCRQRCPLHDLNQSQRPRVCEQRPEQQSAREQTHEQHHIEQCDHARTHMLGGKIARQGQPCGLGRVHAGADQQKGECCTGLPNGDRSDATPRQNQKGKRHDGKATELQKRAKPEIGQAPPTQGRPMRIGTKADQRPQGREQHG